MASINFDAEKSAFRDFYETNRNLLEDAKDSFITLTNALTRHSGNIPIAKIEGRIKDKEECIRKFNRKYRTQLESSSTPYSIKESITDLIGLRVVCLYEDDIHKIKKCFEEHFKVIDITDKISQIEETEGSFGYKGLHLDLKLNTERQQLPEYGIYAEFRFEVQIRTIIQDSWSVLDHKIQYKKSIPHELRRRINILAALFELADREFHEIRNSTIEAIEKEEISDEALTQETEASNTTQEQSGPRHASLNAFSFLKIARHFFKEFEFESHKVDGFTEEIINLQPDITRGKFNYYMRENISNVKRYQAEFEKNNPSDRLNPYTLIRHCLYCGDKQIFCDILTKIAKEGFEKWLNGNGKIAADAP